MEKPETQLKQFTNFINQFEVGLFLIAENELVPHDNLSEALNELTIRPNTFRAILKELCIEDPLLSMINEFLLSYDPINSTQKDAIEADAWDYVWNSLGKVAATEQKKLDDILQDLEPYKNKLFDILWLLDVLSGFAILSSLRK